MNRLINRTGTQGRRISRRILQLTTIMLPLVGAPAFADDVSKLERLLCATTEVHACFETGECFSSSALELGMPQFIVIDTKRKTLSTTEASLENRSTPITHLERNDGSLVVQGFEGGRAFSIMIEESLGALTAAIARGGMSVSVFGACTNGGKS